MATPILTSGVHSDVGGSYPEEESGLAKVSLQWMLNEASIAGLKVEEKAYSKNVLGKTSEKVIGPDVDGMIHESLAGFWHIFEFVPRYKKDRELNKTEWFVPRGRYRTMPDDCLVHESVVQRKASGNQPPNLPENYGTEPFQETILP